ncbi:MAG TPA: alpha/beta fold hydrolase [Longimicrobiales bacterium]|nr:alpha/beta fold hydrolase [Longimicrobiales bacterium]
MHDDHAAIHRITTRDNVSLAVHRLGQAGAAPVLLVPGTFTNWRFWLGTRGTGFARILAISGYEAWVLDFRGHGASQKPAPGQRWTFDQWGREDVVAAVRTISAGGARPLVIGHSAGGASILAALAAEEDIRKAVAAAIIMATPLPWLQNWRRAAAHVMRFAARHLPAFPARLLRLGPEDELPGVMEQWMHWNITGRWVGSDGTDYVDALPRITTPLLFIAGAGDRRFAPVRAVRALHDIAGAGPKAFIIAGSATGFARDYGHADLVVSREARAEVWPLLLDFLRRHRPDHAAGPAPVHTDR